MTNTKMPALFVGHGSPMNAVEDNVWSRGFRDMAALLPTPRVILAVSAHWYTPGTFVTGNERPQTIHDFYGFPQALFDMDYPANGDPDLARRIVDLLGPERASMRGDWGLDHGTWSVLCHLHPKADIPVVQLSVDFNAPAATHVALGRTLRDLRNEGVLVMGSGNVTHNLRHAIMNLHNPKAATPAWAAEFDAEVERATRQHDTDFLGRVVATDAGRMSHPTPDHYLPLLYVMGAADPTDAVRFPMTGFDAGSLSMRSVLVG